MGGGTPGGGAIQRPTATRGSDGTAASGVSNYRSAGRATPFDQRDMKKGPYKGSARQWEEMTSDRARMAEMAIRLDENNREIEMQKLEIRRLREQDRKLWQRCLMVAWTLVGILMLVDQQSEGRCGVESLQLHFPSCPKELRQVVGCQASH